MKSPMVEGADCLTKKSGYSDLQVLRSPAGWYLGTIWTDPDDQTYREPGSRDSGYYAKKEDAEHALKDLEGLGEDIATSLLRDHP